MCRPCRSGHGRVRCEVGPRRGGAPTPAPGRAAVWVRHRSAQASEQRRAVESSLRCEADLGGEAAAGTSQALADLTTPSSRTVSSEEPDRPGSSVGRTLRNRDGRCLPRAGSVLVSPHCRGVDGHTPVDPACGVIGGLYLRQEYLAGSRPVSRPVFADRLSWPEPLWQIPPLDPGTDPVQHPVDHPSVIASPAPTCTTAG